MPPEIIFFDNNCNLKKSFANDPWFQARGLPVDVFHFTCKHSVTDDYCRANCDPGSFPELRGPNNTWFFNSSVAEQTNVWLARYYAMAREMSKEKFNFFFDEMIMRRNVITKARLAKGGINPRTWKDYGM